MEKAEKPSALNKRIIVVIAALTTQFCVGILYIWSLLSGSVQNEFSLSSSAANMVQPLMMFGFVFGNLIGGYAQDKTNPRLIALIGTLMCSGGIALTFFVPMINAPWLIFFTFGIAGLGCGGVYASIVSLLQKWFPNRRGLASGMSAAAFVATAIPLSPLLNWAVRSGIYPSMIFLVYGLITMGINLICCFFIRLPKKETPVISIVSDNTTPAVLSHECINLKPWQAFTKTSFWSIFIFILLFNGVFNVLMPTLHAFGVGYTIQGNYSGRGLGVEQLTVLIALIAVANMSGRLIVGFVSDKIGRRVCLIVIASMTGLGAFALIWANGWVFMLMVLVIAFAFGGGAAVFPPMVIEFSGRKYGATIFGMVLIPLGISSILFVAIHNALYAHTQSYTATMILVSSVNIVPITLMLLYKRFFAFDKKRIDKTIVQETIIVPKTNE